jgi:long-chain acyl-CoA synthetase
MTEHAWFKSYDKGVPHTLAPYPDRTLIDVVDEADRQRPGAVMMIFKGRDITFHEANGMSDALAAALAAQGVRKGDRVALLMPNAPNIIISQFAVWKAGAVAVPINPLFSDGELIQALAECDAEVAIVLTPFYEKVKTVQPRTPLRLIIATNVKDFLSPMVRLIFTLFMEKKGGHRVEIAGDDLWLTNLIEQNAGRSRPAVRVSAADDSLILFSGGTTGVPKGVILTHGAILMNGLQIRAWFGPMLTEWQDTTLLLMPFFHIYGNVILMSTCVVGRHPMALVPNPRDFKDLFETCRKVKPSFFPGIATLFNGLLNHPDVRAGKVDFRSMKMCVAAAMPLLPELKKRFEAATGGRMVEAYGLTESGLLAMGPIFGIWKEGAVGLPTPDTIIRIVDIETGTREMPLGEDGEIIAKAPHLMKGYWRRPDATADMLRDGWLYTGDVGHLDEDGYLFITSRKKDLIKPSGHQVYPGEVEEIILQHAAVQEVAVAGIPDPYQVEAVKAWVVLKPDAQAATEELQEHCRKALASYKVPKFFEFRGSLPKSMVGKVLRRVLQEEEVRNREAAT